MKAGLLSIDYKHEPNIILGNARVQIHAIDNAVDTFEDISERLQFALDNLPEKAVTKCSYCGQWKARKCACKYCGGEA